jgi:excisionase family DNA binding protein
MSGTDLLSDLLAGVPPFNSIKETAKLLRCSRRQITRLIAKGELSVVKLGTGRGCKVLIPRKSIGDLLGRNLSSR